MSFLCLPVRGYVTVSRPIPQATAGFVQPLVSCVSVWKTYSRELFSAIADRVTILATKKTTWHMAPTVSRVLMNRGSQKFPTKGTKVNPHIISVACHRCVTYSLLLKLASATMMFETSAGFEVHEQIQAKTVNHPCMRPKNLFHRGAKAADQRYWAPTVGSIDAISAREMAIRVVPRPAKMLPYVIEAGPPLLRENWNVAAAASQEH